MPDGNYVVYFRRDGKPVYEKIGWASEGWTLEKVLNDLHQLKANYRTGTGPVTLQEKRELEQIRKANEQIKAEQLDKEGMTFSSLFEIYLKQQQADGKKHGCENRAYSNTGFSLSLGNCDCLTLRRFILSASSQT